ncbi:unnamed protein product [Heligmosomoides polygyrus]|uniref:BESS domain-containing protein n=1 Tax=Heligmosomoides polygyrus TaxID=6339 RepID=A0A183FVD9_HELPZ|nr:unnamed protein product [Heligmosomoides polygyrus]
MCQADLDVDDQDNDGDESTPFTEEKQVQWCKRKQEVTSEAIISKLTELMTCRQRLGSNGKQHVSLMQELYKTIEGHTLAGQQSSSSSISSPQHCQGGRSGCTLRKDFIRRRNQQTDQRGSEVIQVHVAPAVLQQLASPGLPSTSRVLATSSSNFQKPSVSASTHVLPPPLKFVATTSTSGPPTCEPISPDDSASQVR